MYSIKSLSKDSFQKEVPITTEATEEPVETAAVLDRRDKPASQPFKAYSKKNKILILISEKS